jgi:IS5 family transposase
MIHSYEVTPASVYDGQVFETLLNEDNNSLYARADASYRSEEKLGKLKKQNYREHLQRKGCRHKKLTDREAQGNQTSFRIRSRTEQVFGV